jgi:hypothetical protein
MKAITKHRPDRPKWMWVAGAVGAGLIALGAIDAAMPDPEPSPVRLEVEADGPTDIRLSDPNGGDHATETDQSGQWSEIVGTDQDGEWRVGVSPSFMSSTTEVSCRMYIGETLVDEAHGTGSHGSARCSTR